MGDLSVLRADDLPLLYEEVSILGIQALIDDHLSVHGNREGLSLGHLVSIWLCYMLSESDHRLSSVEAWVDRNQVLLRSLSGQSGLRSKDFTDDRLGQALDYLSTSASQLAINDGLNKQSLSVYQLDSHGTVRLDAAPMQSHHKVAAGGLHQYGYSKHHNGQLAQLKVKLACVDNKLNGFGYPLAHLVVSGEQSDDVLYMPIIDQCEATFAQAGYQERKLYIGDSKMGSGSVRDHIVVGGNDYLVPLSKKQLSSHQRHILIKASDPSTWQQVYTTDKEGHNEPVAQGFERELIRSYEHEGARHQYKERQLFILSTSYAESAQKAFDQHLLQAEKDLAQLLVPKQGKQLPTTQKALNEKIAQLLAEKGLQKFFKIDIQTTQEHRNIRAYKNRPARVETTNLFSLNVHRDLQAIEAHKQTLGWQVYATSAPLQTLSLEACVWKYRQQNRVESRFHDLRNKVVPLLPLFLTKDNRIEALIFLLMICLKICALIEYKVAEALSQNQEKIDNVFEGNPKKATSTPTAKRLLNCFKDISLAIIPTNQPQSPNVMITPLKPVQVKIIELMGLKADIYTSLPDKIRICILEEKISET